jgi:death on curing protein
VEWEWLLDEAVDQIHDQQLQKFGGISGIRDAGLLASALQRPKNRAYYENASVTEMAATYAIAIAQGHPYMDGNKRTGFIVAATFLALNGWVLNATDAEVVQAFLDVANGVMDEAALAEWFENHIVKSKLES